MNTKSQGICAAIWSAMSGLSSGGLPGPGTPTTRGATRPDAGDNSLGHGNGVDNDLKNGSTGAQDAGSDARDNASSSALNQTVAECPDCKVAIVIGDSSASQEAHSEPMDVAEWTYNDDIAKRTVELINSQSGGKITAEIFHRVSAGSYSREMATVYAKVNEFLAEVPSQKRIAIELHYNSVKSTAARFSEVLYKGDISYAQNSVKLLAAIFGGKDQVRRYSSNPRGQATFTNGPTNTYLMEPFFGSNPASAAIAMCEDGKQQLAQAYATSLIDWIG
ncbi:N-acetylmuramoyl-L-alanine amidase [Paracoccus sulfuroxidans]|uniref:N-acetylmuramoyl-L-alanine amidase n=2 Tax=Paracoccus sulfuroxidans TaxID=384678 RepID=A0A562NH30_9RHOB|nr:N-acetylmuramoyl-L-alanine amidase [Paracoccus sulfuroxidans]